MTSCSFLRFVEFLNIFLRRYLSLLCSFSHSTDQDDKAKWINLVEEIIVVLANCIDSLGNLLTKDFNYSGPVSPLPVH